MIMFEVFRKLFSKKIKFQHSFHVFFSKNILAERSVPSDSNYSLYLSLWCPASPRPRECEDNIIIILMENWGGDNILCDMIVLRKFKEKQVKSDGKFKNKYKVSSV